MDEQNIPLQAARQTPDESSLLDDIGYEAAMPDLLGLGVPAPAPGEG